MRRTIVSAVLAVPPALVVLAGLGVGVAIENIRRAVEMTVEILRELVYEGSDP